MTLDSRVVITGGTGKLGSALRARFPDAIYPTRNDMDISDRASVESFFNSQAPIDTVIHLAALTDVRRCQSEPALAYKTNVLGARNVALESKRHRVKHFIYLSTACVFPGDNLQVSEDEDSIPRPKNYYGVTKFAAEEIIRTLRCADFVTTIARTNFTTMPWEYPKAFVDRFGTYLFAEDIAVALGEVVEERPGSETIHICGEDRLSMYEYATLGGSQVGSLTLEQYDGPELTVNMSLTTKNWRSYKIGFAGTQGITNS